MRSFVKSVLNLRFKLLPDRWLHSPTALADYRLLSRSQWWSADEIAAFQLQRIQALVAHAYENSPFHRRRFEQIGLQPGDVRSLDDFRKIPYMTKTDVRGSLEDMKATNFEQLQPILTHTGGTTGAPLSLYRSQATADMRQAVEWRTYDLAGYSFRDLKIYAYGGMGADDQTEPWYEDHRNHVVAINTIRANRERIELFCKLFREKQPRLLTGNIEFYRIMGKYLEAKGVDDIRAEAMFSQGESLTESDREKMYRWFGCPVFDYYGMRENAVSASECHAGSMHVNSEFVHMEFEIDGHPAAAGEQADIIGTSLVNYAMPLIRYKTDDSGVRLGGGCDCGRHLPTMAITGGRGRDFIATRSEMIYINHHATYLLGLSDGVEAIQFYQPSIDRLIIRVQANERYRASDGDRLVVTVRDLIREPIQIAVELVEAIPRTRLGKYRFVVSEVDPVL